MLAPMMTEAQRDLVRESFPALAKYGEDLAMLFYERLFQIAPHLRPLFKRDLKEQSRRFMATLGLVISNVNRVPQIVPVLQELGRRHQGYGVSAADYEPVGEALVWAVGRRLGRDMTPEMREAWIAAYRMIADLMQGASKGEAA